MSYEDQGWLPPEKVKQVQRAIEVARRHGLFEHGWVVARLDEAAAALDALAARDDLDLLEITEAIRDDPQYVPYIRRAHPRLCQAPHESPRCGPHCQMRFIGEA